MKHYRRDRLVAAGWEVRDGSSFLVEPGPVATARRALAAVQALDGWLSAHAADQPEVLGEVLGVLGAIDSAALAARVRTITAASTAEVAVADGQVSHAAWVAKVLGMTGTAARNECRTATELADSPEVLADLAAGRISRDQIAAVLAAARRQAADQEAAARARAAEREAERRRREARNAADQAAASSAADRLRRARTAAERERRAREEEERQERARREQDRQDRQARQEDLLGRAREGAAPDHLRQEERRQRNEDPAARARSAAAQHRRRSAHDWIDEDTQMGRVEVHLPLDAMAAYQAAMQAAMTADPKGTPPEERRTYQQKRADAFIDMVGASLGGGRLPRHRGVRPHITLTMTAGTLTGLAEDPCTTTFGIVVPSESVRRIACDAWFTRVVMDPEGQALDVGRETKDWTIAQYRAVASMFGGCAFPVADGVPCGRPMEWTDIHHVEWWDRDEGPTDLVNGCPLCRRHHTYVHQKGWQLSYDMATMTVTVTRPTDDGGTLTRSVRFRDGRPVPMGEGPAGPATFPDPERPPP